MDKKKLLVIGAGISGLSAAIYACNSGFDVTVLEKCHNPGGQHTDASGGLPVAVASGRKAVKCLCRDTWTNFIE